MQTNLSAVARKVKKIYFDSDVKMKDVAKVCAVECAHCCHQTIRVHMAEGPAIEKFIQEDMNPATKATVANNVRDWLDYFDASTPNGRPIDDADLLQFDEKVIADRKACPFLVKNKCSIYKARPIVCRTHSVNDSAKLCEVTPNRRGNIRGYSIQRIALVEMSKEADMVGVRLLPYAVQQALGVNRTCKPVALEITPTLSGGI